MTVTSSSSTSTFQCPAVIYSIPPLRSNTGYRAKDWDLSQPMWEGTVEVIEETIEETCEENETKDKAKHKYQCHLRLADSKGELFANAPYTTQGTEVQPVTDSSRYYAIRVSDGTGRHATLGLGLLDRNDAFDFSMALQNFKRRASPLVTKSRIVVEEQEEDEEFGEFV